MRILIADDEAPARQRLAQLLQAVPDCRVAGMASDGEGTLQMALDQQPDIILLDVSMPKLDGLSVAEMLFHGYRGPDVILVTAYPEHAIRACNLGVAGYLLKPVRSAELVSMIERVRVRRLARQASPAQAEVSEPARRSYVCAQFRGNIERIQVSRIKYFLADSKYITVRHDGGEALIEESLKRLHQEFHGDFMRIHRNALVAHRVLRSVLKDPRHGSWMAVLDDCEDRLAISRRHVAQVRRFIKSR